MGRQLDEATFVRETILQPKAKTVEPAKVCCPKREAGSRLNLTGETNALLRSRLRAAALILLVGFGAFLVRHLAGVLAGEPLDWLLLAAHLLVVLVLAFNFLPLCRQCPESMRRLRVTELVIFGLPAAFFLLLQERVTLSE